MLILGKVKHCICVCVNCQYKSIIQIVRECQAKARGGAGLII